MGRRLQVSVIIPTYNRLEFLKEAVSSVFAQGYGDIELIVVDDGSTDGTEEWCINVDDERCKYIKIAHCGLPGRVRNIGIREAQGEFIAFLDSDDLWNPGKIEKQVMLMKEKREYVVCHTREKWIRNGKVISQSKQRHRRWGDIFEDALVKCIIGPSTVMLRRNVFEYAGLFDEDMEIAEDYDLWLRVTALYRVCYIEEPLVVKRGGHSDQLSEKYGQIEIFRIRGLENFIEWVSGAGESFLRLGWGIGRLTLIKTLAYRELARKCDIYAKGCIKRAKLEEARLYLAKKEKYNTLYRQCSIF